MITLFAKNLIDEIMLEIPNEPDPSKIKNPYCSSLEQVKDYKTADLISRYKNC